MTDYVPGEAAEPRDESMAPLGDVGSAAFADDVLDGSVPFDALELNDTDATPASVFSWPSIGPARSGARAASTATFVPNTDGSLSWETAREVVIEGDNLQDKLSLHKLAWDEAMRTHFALRYFDVTPDGTVGYVNATDHDGLRIELQLGAEIRR